LATLNNYLWLSWECRFSQAHLSKTRLASVEIGPMNQNIKIQIDKIKEVIIQKLKDKGIISLYLGGTVPSEDRIPSSDIDVLGVVEPNFNFKEEEKLNSHLTKYLAKEIGIEVTFRGITLSELNGGKREGTITRWVPIRILIKRLPFFKYLSGKKLDFSEFRVKRYDPQQEAKVQIKNIRRNIESLREETEGFPLRDITKHLLSLIALEAEIEYGFTFDPSYEKLAKHLEKEKGHIVHRAMALRKKPQVSRTQILHFCSQAEKYLDDLKRRSESWKA